MTSRFVRVTGRMEDAYGQPLTFGIDHDKVTIDHDPHESGIELGAAEIDEFARLFVAACWEAARCHQCDCPPEYQHPEETSNGF